MSKNTRVASVIAAAAIAIAAFIALRPDDDTTSTTTTAAPVTIPDQTTAPATPTKTPARDERATVIEVKDKVPVGGVKKLTVKEGKVVRFTVSSDQAGNVHLHGYDIEEPVSPGADAKFSVPATITGVFEVELEDSGVQIAKLTVEPRP